MRFFWGLLILGVGLFFIMRTDSLMRLNGRIAWAEYHLETMGGTRALYKLIGIGFIILSFMLITNLAGTFFFWALGPIFRIGV